jgi:hypothetical protein
MRMTKHLLCSVGALLCADGKAKISLQNRDRQRLRDEMNEVIIKLFIWLIEKYIAVSIHPQHPRFLTKNH